MEKIQVIQPTKLLAPYIKQYWFLRIDDVKQGFQRSIPAGCVALVFHKGNKIISSFHKGTQPQSYISGQISTYSDIEFSFLDIGKGIGAISGVALQLLFMDAHLKVQDKSEIFSDYLQRRVNVLKAFFKQAHLEWSKACDNLIIEPEIVPYIIEDELSKINILTSANGNKQIASRRATIQRLGWADNVDEEEKAIINEEDRENSYYQNEPTI